MHHNTERAKAFRTGLKTKIQELVAQRLSQKRIADTLNALDIKKRQGGTWHQVDVGRFMKAEGIEPAYTWPSSESNNS